MALTSNTVFDSISQTASILFYQSSSLVDEITLASNNITYATISSYNMSQSDMALYYKYLNSYLSFLYQNFPIMNLSQKLIWPLCLYEINNYSLGVQHLTYTQSSQGYTFLTINYIPVSQAGSMAARTATTISPQEFIMGVNMKANYFNQVSLS